MGDFFAETERFLDEARRERLNSQEFSDRLSERTRIAIAHFEWCEARSRRDQALLCSFRQARPLSLDAAKLVGGKIFASFLVDFFDLALEMALTSYSLGERIYEPAWFECICQMWAQMMYVEKLRYLHQPFWLKWWHKWFPPKDDPLVTGESVVLPTVGIKV